MIHEYITFVGKININKYKQKYGHLILATLMDNRVIRQTLNKMSNMLAIIHLHVATLAVQRMLDVNNPSYDRVISKIYTSLKMQLCKLTYRRDPLCILLHAVD